MSNATADRLSNRLRRQVFRVLIATLARGRRGQEALIRELRRAKGGALGLVHETAEDWLIECGDHLIWTPAGDQLIGAGLVKHGSWQRREFELGLATLKAHGRWRDGVFLDVGANIGTQSVYAALARGIDRVIAFEPEPKNFDYLCRNAALNDLSDQITCRQIAVSDRQDRLRLKIFEKLHGRHSLTTDPDVPSIEVGADTLDALLAAEGLQPSEVALIWIDVEGHEHQVFKGMTGLLAAGVPIYFEYGRRKRTPEEIKDWRALLGPAYSKAFVMHPDRAEPTDLDAMFDITFGDLLIF